MIPLLILALQQFPQLPPSAADTSPFRRLELPAPSPTRSAGGMPGPAYWQQRADYKIRASLDTATQLLSGTVTIHYTNNSPDTLRYLWLHVEQNLLRPDSRGAALNAAPNAQGMGFAGRWFRSAGISVPSAVALRPARGRTVARVPLVSRVNGTLLRLDLDRPLGPAGNVELELAFEFRTPEKGTFRTAHGQVGDGRIYEIGQWYPRLAVYDDVRGWNTEQYLGNGEFYLEYGDFDVSITVPRNFIVAATGKLENESDVLLPAQRDRLALARRSDSVVAIITKAEAGQASSRPAGTAPTLTWRFRAANVRDFAWAAAPHFRWDAVGWDGILAQAFYPATAPASWTWQGWPPDSTWAHSAERVRFAIRHYSEKWSRYPYPTATNVHGPTGSMEYPMLCFCGTGASVRDLTATTLHEMAHQWFPMIVGSNERAHAWMDEGFANFLTVSGWRTSYPGESFAVRTPGTDYWTQSASGWALADRWIAAATGGRDEAPMIPPDRAPSLWSQNMRPQAALYLLRHHVLDDTTRFDAAFREYIRRWAFKHPTPADFFRTMEDATGEDLSWFWRGAFFRTDVLDLAVDSVLVQADTTGRRTTHIHLASHGGFPMPVVLRLTFADGTTESIRLPVEIWYRGSRYIYARDFPVDVTRVEIDWEQVLPDVRRENNVWPSPRQGSAPVLDPYPHAAEPIGTVRQIYDGVLTPQMAVNTFRNIDRLFPTRTVPRASTPKPLPPAATPLRTVTFSDRGKQYDLEDYLELNRVAGLLVLKDGRVKLEKYRFGNSERTRWMSMSIAKSVTSTLIGAAVKQGQIASLSDPVTRYVPSLAGSAYDGVSVRDVLTMSSGVRWNETYTDPASDRRRLLEAQIAQRSGSALAVMRGLPRAAEPGTVNSYNTGETQVAAEILRSAVGLPLATYLSERIWSRFGMEADANWWLDSPDGTEIGGSGFSATLRDYGRFGLFILDGGIAAGEEILPDGWIREATTPKVLRGGTTLAYGYLWWTGSTPASKRDGAFTAEGIHGQFLYVNPVAKVVIVVWGAQPAPTGGAVINDYLFFDAVTEALR